MDQMEDFSIKRVNGRPKKTLRGLVNKDFVLNGFIYWKHGYDLCVWLLIE